jgi:hypothetical protein
MEQEALGLRVRVGRGLAVGHRGGELVRRHRGRAVGPRREPVQGQHDLEAVALGARDLRIEGGEPGRISSWPLAGSSVGQSAQKRTQRVRVSLK